MTLSKSELELYFMTYANHHTYCSKWCEGCVSHGCHTIESEKCDCGFDKAVEFIKALDKPSDV